MQKRNAKALSIGVTEKRTGFNYPGWWMLWGFLMLESNFAGPETQSRRLAEDRRSSFPGRKTPSGDIAGRGFG